MSRALVVRNHATIIKDTLSTGETPKVRNGVEMGNVQSIPVRRTTPTPSTSKELANARLYNKTAEQSARIAELETDLQNLWQQYAGSRRMKLDLLDANQELESKICQLKKDLAYETRLRGIAEAKLEATDGEEPVKSE